MKGISPIVAAVLLIAITMTIAGVLAYWSTTFVKRTLPEESRAELEAVCRFANFDFESCTYNSSTGTIRFILNNRRDVDLKNLTAFVKYKNYTVSEISLNADLPGGKLRSFNISNISPDFLSILIKTNCPDVVASSTCTRV